MSGTRANGESLALRLELFRQALTHWPTLADKSPVLRAESNAQFVIVPWSLDGMFEGRYAVQCGKRIFDVRWKKPAFEALRATQKEHPVPLLKQGKRKLWHFHDNFYWDGDGLESGDVKALALQRERQMKQKLQTAHSLMRAEEAGHPSRVGVPTDLRRAVYERDGGECVECGSSFDLQYDHLLPVSRGGATTIENLQLLCGDCNRRKSNSL